MASHTRERDSLGHALLIRGETKDFHGGAKFFSQRGFLYLRLSIKKLDLLSFKLKLLLTLKMVCYRVARWNIFKRKILIWVNLGWPGPGMEKVGIFFGRLEYISAIWYILWPFGNLFM
jgi:hypothetical protein